MANFTNAFAKVILLALFATLSLADESGPIASPPQVAAGPIPDDYLSPEAQGFINFLVDELFWCFDGLSQSNATDCIDTFTEVVGKGKNSTLSEQCCKNVLDVDATKPTCWDLIFHSEKKSRGLVTKVVGSCSEVIRSPISTPKPLSRKTLVV